MTRVNLRKPAVAGRFYSSSPVELKKQIRDFAGYPAERKKVIACMLPHAGYTYSGKIAAQTVAQVDIKEKIILLGPNHTGYGHEFSIMTEGVWQTPLGENKIDSILAGELLKNSEYLAEDPLAHMYEHSLEVELPILQYFKADFQIVPLAFMSNRISALKEIGKEIGDFVNASSKKDSIMLIASSDMTHYESQDDAIRKDKEAIDAILELDEDKLVKKIKDLNISMCGYAPVVTMIKAAKIIGATNASLVAYQTSGDVTGIKDEVVGYAGIIIY